MWLDEKVSWQKIDRGRQISSKEDVGALSFSVLMCLAKRV